MSNTSTNGCSYTDGPQYVGCQVAEKGWPMPSQSGGKRSKRTMCKTCRKIHQNGCAKKSMRKGKGGKNRKGGFLGQAIVPFGLFALQKRTQQRGDQKKYGGKSRKSRKSRKNRSSRRR
jgi:hypothetical protein